MIVGIPRETKDGERRVGLTPEGATALACAGHDLKVQSGAGDASGFTDAAYVQAGARIVSGAAEAFDADLVVKVKEIQPAELDLLRPDSILFCFQHLQSDRALADALRRRRVAALAYETVEDASGGLPLLAPMSAIAGELAVTIAAHALMVPQGGRGLLLSEARVLIVGMGSAGLAATRTARALGAQVECFGRRATPALQDSAELPARIGCADVIIGAANNRGGRSPRLLSRPDMRRMRPGSVMVEVCIDGGGIAETSRPTTHADPLFIDEGIVHYCVPNMPAAVPHSATRALCAATLPRILSIAGQGLWSALRQDAGLAAGLHLAQGQVTHPAIAEALGLPCHPADVLLHACGQR